VLFPRFRFVLVLGLAFLCVRAGTRVRAAQFEGALAASQAPAAKDRAPMDKKNLTPEQQKINTMLWNAIRQHRGEAGRQGVPTQPVKLRRDQQQRVLVDIRAIVSQQLNSRIEKLDGKVVATDERHQSTLAYLPLDSLEELAKCSEVRFIVPAAEPATH